MNVFEYSSPRVYVYPLATNLALCFSIEPFALCLMANTHLQPIFFFPFSNSTTSQVPFLCEALISSNIASLHLGSFKASCTLLGIDFEIKLVVKAL